VAPDSPDKFKQILDSLQRLREWFENETWPDGYPMLMNELYGAFPRWPGNRSANCLSNALMMTRRCVRRPGKSCRKWIAQEKSDVEQDRELYRRELMAKAASRPPLPEDQVYTREAALDRQIADQTRLLLQLESKRSLWGADSKAEADGADPGSRPDGEAAATADGAVEPEGEGGAPGTVQIRKLALRGRQQMADTLTEMYRYGKLS
jgi:hypothetical protein